MNNRPRDNRPARRATEGPRTFTLISLEDYLVHHMATNPQEDRKAVRAALQEARAARERGACCRCGALIWAIGSAFTGDTCFTCATGESDSSADYELL